jgi:hypothetical protein
MNEHPLHTPSSLHLKHRKKKKNLSWRYTMKILLNISTIMFLIFVIAFATCLSKIYLTNHHFFHFHSPSKTKVHQGISINQTHHTWKFDNLVKVTCCNPNVGLVTKARVCKVTGQEGSQESHNILPGCEKVWRNEPSHPKAVPLWELDSWCTLEFSERNCRGQTQWLEELFISLEISWKVDI